ncbi:SHOCT domain-containing protein [Natrialbaceae archaeon AArc-T1-2]|uniref:SHOCT domain-containing protein n=1 Tax=Natrialbaceae archaeon AArc-T1-2 TaxID=3053904 RepID=UPI00255AD9CD|nr:SHOCT domain-containing protein [Natrialbaceae archaeon AArc-T1-2]WIV66784.1 SHOCT domain-containing protein [Natrialbaceae archaeon AArc-T1-2]
MSESDDLVRLVVLVIAILLLAPIVMMLFMTPMMGAHGPWVDATNGVGWGWGWLFAWLVPLLVVVAIGYLVYRVIASPDSRDDAAMEELRIAYARGEISEEEFEERRRRLQREE